MIFHHGFHWTKINVIRSGISYALSRRKILLLSNKPLRTTDGCFNLARDKSSFAVLGIETSCDDTGVAVVNDEKKILGESLYSQTSIHVEYVQRGRFELFLWFQNTGRLDFVINMPWL